MKTGKIVVSAFVRLKIKMIPHHQFKNPRVLIFSNDYLNNNAIASSSSFSLLLQVSNSFKTFVTLGVPAWDRAKLSAGFICYLVLVLSWISANSFQL